MPVVWFLSGLTCTEENFTVKAGAQGLIVSNHGGRQLDGVKSSVAALPRIVDAVGGKIQSSVDAYKPYQSKATDAITPTPMPSST